MRLFILCAVLTGFFAAGASDLSESLFSAYQKIPELQLALKDDYYARKLYLTEFLLQHGGYDCYEKNRLSLNSICESASIQSEVNRMLEKSIIDKNLVKKIMKDFKYPMIHTVKTDNFIKDLEMMIDDLRVPNNDGTYRYASYVKTVSYSADKQELKAQHGLPEYQKYEKSFRGKIFRIHIFSPTKIGLFDGNRDAYLGKLSIQYIKGGQTKNVVQSYERILKRGESVDFELPEIADSATVSLTFSCQPEHKGKAYLYIEPQCASLKDDRNSPYYPLIDKIRSFKTGSALDTVNALNILSEELLIAFRHAQSEREPDKKSQSGQGISEDSARYFYYMLSDPSVSRTALKEKFSSMFLDQK